VGVWLTWNPDEAMSKETFSGSGVRLIERSPVLLSQLSQTIDEFMSQQSIERVSLDGWMLVAVCVTGLCILWFEVRWPEQGMRLVFYFL
jgi:hypothetical protein